MEFKKLNLISNVLTVIFYPCAAITLFSYLTNEYYFAFIGFSIFVIVFSIGRYIEHKTNEIRKETIKLADESFREFIKIMDKNDDDL